MIHVSFSPDQPVLESRSNRFCLSLRQRFSYIVRWFSIKAEVPPPIDRYPVFPTALVFVCHFDFAWLLPFSGIVLLESSWWLQIPSLCKRRPTALSLSTEKILFEKVLFPPITSIDLVLRHTWCDFKNSAKRKTSYYLVSLVNERRATYCYVFLAPVELYGAALFGRLPISTSMNFSLVWWML